MQFLELRCPNQPKEYSRVECGREMGGPSIDTLMIHNWEKPFVDCRYCPACGLFWKVTIEGMKSVPRFEIIDRDDNVRINLVRIHDVFLMSKVSGKRIVRKSR